MAEKMNAMDSLAKARLFGKSMMTPTERRQLAEQRMAEQVKRPLPTSATTSANSNTSGRQLLERMREENALAGETGIKRRRMTKKAGY